jgi:hypothetical protein
LTAKYLWIRITLTEQVGGDFAEVISREYFR